jgi:hypothetical protein
MPPSVHYAHTYALPNETKPFIATQQEFASLIERKEKSLYEIILTCDTITRFFTDSDFYIPREDFSESLCRRVEDKIKHYLFTSIKELTGTEIHLATATSHTASYDADRAKISIRCYGINLKSTPKVMKAFIKKLNELIRSGFDKDDNLYQYIDSKEDPFDLSIYNNRRAMRCINTSKPNENRPLKLASGSIEQTIIQCPADDAIEFAFQPESPTSVVVKQLYSVSINTDKMLELGGIIKMEYINLYHDWLKIVWSLQSESEQYKEVAREISKRSKKYDDEGFDKAWDDYKPGCVSVGTFYNYCKVSNEKKYRAIIEKYTPKPEIKITDSRSYDSVKRQFEKTHLLISNKALFIRQTETVNIIMTKTQLITSNERISYDIVVKDETKSKCFILDWLKDGQNRMKYDMAVYPPDIQCPDSVFNLWRPFTMERITLINKDENAISMMRGHIKILCGNDQAVADYLELWIAQMIQCPSVKSICPTLISKEGAGKGTLMRLFERMFGSEKILQTTKPSQYVFGNFNGQMTNVFFVNMDEMSKKEGEGADGHLKGLITEPRITINEKGIIPYEIASYHRFLITTNNEDPVKTSKDDRRKLIVRASDELIGNRDYFDKMYAMLEDENAVKSIYEYFKGLPGADKFSKVPLPETEYHKDIKEAQMSPIELWLRHFVTENINLAFVEKSTMEQYEAFNVFKADTGIHFECPLVTFSLKLKNLKVDGVGEVMHTRTGNKRIFDIPKMKGHFKIGCLI